MSCGSFGSFLKMAVEPSVGSTPVTFDATSERYEPLAESLRVVDSVVSRAGLTGYLDPIQNHLRVGQTFTQGRVLMNVGPNELTTWLPRILHNAASGTTFATSATVTNFPVDVMLERDNGVSVYRGMRVNQALFRARSSQEDSEEQVVQMALDLVGIEEHNDQTWPAIEPTLATAQRLYWLLADSALTLGGTEYPVDAFNLLIDNQLQVLFRNSLLPTCIRSRGRRVRLQAPTPYDATSHSNLFQSRFDGTGSLSLLGTKNLTGESESTYETTFSFGRLFQNRQSPATRGRGEIPLTLDLEAYRTAAAEIISVVNDASLAP